MAIFERYGGKNEGSNGNINQINNHETEFTTK